MATRQRICRIRVLAKNSPFLANSSTRQNGLFRKCVRLARLADIRQAVSRGLARLADIFEKNVTRLDTFAQVIRHSRKFGASGHCLVETYFFYLMPRFFLFNAWAIYQLFYLSTFASFWCKGAWCIDIWPSLEHINIKTKEGRTKIKSIIEKYK